MKQSLFLLLLSISLMLGIGACSKTEDTPAQKTIVGVAQGNADLSILVDALTYTDLVGALNGTDKYTVFAPTNAAFTSLLATLGVSKVTDIDKATLKSILLYHVVSGEVSSSAITTGYVKSISPFGTTTSNLSLYVVKDASGVKINNGAKVTTADVTASNGVVHVVDKVITIPNVVNHALNNPNFSTLVAALTRTDLLVDYVLMLWSQDYYHC
jgi:uncharacterized surface protein with fasciclin (FAS1) repeats